jgi:ribosomal protein S26
MRNVSDKSCTEIKTHILCSVTFPQNRAVDEMMWKNMVETEKPQMTV